MKQRWQGVRLALLCSVAIGWWGLWYPELATAADTYVIVYEDGTVQTAAEVIECGLDEQACWELLQMDGEQIHFRSKLWQSLEEYIEKVRSEE
ncbi:MAG: hypothetical protein IJ379_04390 [Lachnospiraceae bacterium]|nr:hypothetical protein [Lachnospiraceae bacterium]